MMFLHKSELLHKSLWLRIMTAEVAVDHSLILSATLLKDLLAERVRNLCIEDALLLEERECVSLENLSPLVRIVAG